MMASRPQKTDFCDLKDFIYQTLCEHERLEIGVFPMTERVLKRGAEPCGMFFCLHGPRSVKFTAIWDTKRNMIFFYGATGERFHETRLMESSSIALTNTN